MTRKTKTRKRTFWKTLTWRLGTAVAIGGVGLVLAAVHDRSTVDVDPQVDIISELSQSQTSITPHAQSFRPMPASVRAQFDAWLMTTYAKCWHTPKSLPEGDPYAPKVRIAFGEDGKLASPPKLINPPADPVWKPYAEAALKAVKGCSPLNVPEKYAAYYPSWKTKTVYFDPAQN